MKISKLKPAYFGLVFIATASETNGQYFMSETIVPGGDNGPPMHVHTKEDESFYLRKGNLTFIVNDKIIEMKEGEFLNIEKGEKHTWMNKTLINAELIITFAPAGIEKMFVELEKNVSEIKKIGRKYGTLFDI